MAGSGIFRSVKEEALEFKDSFMMIVAYLFLKDPCEKCIVRACCSERCEIKVQTINMIMPHKTILYAKLFSIAILFNFLIAILVLIASLVGMF